MHSDPRLCSYYHHPRVLATCVDWATDAVLNKSSEHKACLTCHKFPKITIKSQLPEVNKKVDKYRKYREKYKKYPCPSVLRQRQLGQLKYKDPKAMSAAQANRPVGRRVKGRVFGDDPDAI